MTAPKTLVWTGSAADPGGYYYYDSVSAAMSLLARPYGKMTDKVLADMESVSYAARDGLQIPGLSARCRAVSRPSNCR